MILELKLFFFWVRLSNMHAPPPPREVAAWSLLMTTKSPPSGEGWNIFLFSGQEQLHCHVGLAHPLLAILHPSKLFIDETKGVQMPVYYLITDYMSIPYVGDDKISHLRLINMARHKFCHYPSRGVSFCLNISVWLCGVWHLYSFVWQICAPTCKKKEEEEEENQYCFPWHILCSWVDLLSQFPFPSIFFYQSVSIALGLSSW